MRSNAASRRSAAASASSVSLDIAPASSRVSRELKAGEALNVKQIACAPLVLLQSRPYPAVVIHGLADARTVLAAGSPVTFLSAPGAALFAGCGWWRALIERANS